MAAVLELREKMAELSKAATVLLNTIDSEKRDATEEELGQLQQYSDEQERVEREIETRLKLDAQKLKLSEPSPRKAEPNQPPGTSLSKRDEDARREVIRVNSTDADRVLLGNGGYASLGDFAKDVKHSGRQGAEWSKRLSRYVQHLAPTTYSSEGVGADGGFAVPPDFRNAILSKVMGEGSLASYCDQMQTASNSITVPKDETTPWGTGGIQCTWEGEGGALTQTKPAIDQVQIRLNKISALVPMTDELLEDAPAMTSFLNRKVGEIMTSKLNLAIVQGTGAGQPLGILNAGCTVQQAKEGSQTADTVNANNIAKMWSRLYAPWRSSPGCVWLINQDVEPQLNTMVFGGTTTPYPVYLPAGGYSVAPFSTIMGRPVVPVQACETVGDVGDIILCDLKQYMLATKVDGLRTDTSIHLFFDYGMTAFRFIMRVAGQPWWTASISPRDGSTTMGPFVTLEAR